MQRKVVNLSAPDLAKHPPRSPRVRLGGYALLPRTLDKCRATIARTNGEYHFNCPMDQHFFAFTGLSAQAFKNEAAKGRSDGAMLEWVRKHARPKRTEAEIVAWSTHLEQRAPSEGEGRQYLQDTHAKIAPKRDDIATWFDLLDLDDYVTFGGKA